MAMGIKVMRDRNYRQEAKMRSIPTHHRSCAPLQSPQKQVSRESVHQSGAKQPHPHSLALPLILPHKNGKSKRYPIQHNPTQEDSPLAILHSQLQARTVPDKGWLNQSLNPNQTRRERLALDRVDSMREAFTRSVLDNNGIGRVQFARKDKLKVYIEEGNHSRLINELVRRRTNLRVVPSKKDAQLVWTPFCDWEASRESSRFVESEARAEQGTEREEQSPVALRRELTRGRSVSRLKDVVVEQLFMHNHLPNHHEVSDKKCLLKNIRRFCKARCIEESNVIPLTYHVEGPADLPGEVGEGTWIVKPGEDTNRGVGISVQTGASSIEKAVGELYEKGKSALVQQYIEPLLYRGRKFDIRCFALVTSVAGRLRAYWYREGYLRTCCREYSTDPANLFGHLTNDSIQKKHRDYGKYEAHNKLSFSELEALLKARELSYEGVLERMRELAEISLRAAEERLRCQRSVVGFEIYGYDFLVDARGKVWLIEVNTNPCLEFAGSLLSRVIWHMVENSLAIALDPWLGGLPESYSSVREQHSRVYADNKFVCIL